LSCWRGKRVQKGKAGLEGGAAFGSVFSLGRDGEGPAEILLMQPLDKTEFSRSGI
jgi:hypothetical protein